MSRFIISCILLGAVITTAISGLFFIKVKKDTCSEILQLAYTQAKDGEIEKAEENVKKFNEKWGKIEKWLMIFLHREDLDDITFSSRVILEYIRAEEMPEFYAELKKIMALLDHTLETEMPLIENIL